MQSWQLLNAAEIAEENKYTFYRPSNEIIGKVRVGEVVKLIFEFESDDPEAPRAERMWVVVDSIDGRGGFTGRLNNEPRYIRGVPAASRQVKPKTRTPKRATSRHPR